MAIGSIATVEIFPYFCPRFYTLYGWNNFTNAHEACRADGMRLAKWDTLEKYYDVGFLTSEKVEALV